MQRLKIILYIVLIFVFIVVGVLFYLYQHGGVENYIPPKTKVESPRIQVMNDLTTLSRAIEVFYAMNLRYPDSLAQLQPDFVVQIPHEPVTGRMYTYQTDGIAHYRISVSDPTAIGVKELAIENGKIIQQ
jgi:hypothetical protein